MMSVRKAPHTVLLRYTFTIGCAFVLVAGVVPRGAVGQQAPTASSNAASQRLAPGDIVRLKIWREADLSGDYRVDERGIAVFPKLGPLSVASMPPDSLQARLVTSYSRFLQDASVEVIFLHRVNILGEVRTPGLYHVDPTMTLADVLAMSGGVNADGNAKKVELIRNGHRMPFDISLQSRFIDSPLRSGDQIRVPQRGWLTRNAGVVAAGITGAALVAAALIRP